MCYLLFMVGALIIVSGFFKEYRGKRYVAAPPGEGNDNPENGDVEETREYKKWRAEKISTLKKGLWFMVPGIVLKMLSYIIQILTGFFQ
ncbi:hypothetical protein ACFL1R_10040 [Candidatus Latescibacterota bacterium]